MKLINEFRFTSIHTLQCHLTNLVYCLVIEAALRHINRQLSGLLIVKDLANWTRQIWFDLTNINWEKIKKNFSASCETLFTENLSIFRHNFQLQSSLNSPPTADLDPTGSCRYAASPSACQDHFGRFPSDSRSRWLSSVVECRCALDCILSRSCLQPSLPRLSSHRMRRVHRPTSRLVSGKFNFKLRRTTKAFETHLRSIEDDRILFDVTAGSSFTGSGFIERVQHLICVDLLVFDILQQTLARVLRHCLNVNRFLLCRKLRFSTGENVRTTSLRRCAIINLHLVRVDLVDFIEVQVVGWASAAVSVHVCGEFQEISEQI